MSSNDNAVPLLHLGSSKTGFREGQPWQDGFWRRAPWLALVALLGFLGCCVGMIVVLVESDGRPVTTWPSAPTHKMSVSVLLSLLVSLGNFLLSAALSRGYEIAWWLQAIRGADLRRLQADLNVQTHTLAVVCSARHHAQLVSPFVVAAVVSLLVSLLDGPLIQKASSIGLHTHTTAAASLSVPVTRGLLPFDFSGYGGEHGTEVDALMPVFREVYHDYGSRTAIELNVAGCGSNTTCIFELPAAGFDIHCTNTTVPYDFEELAAAEPSNNNITVFSVVFGFPENVAAGYNEINFTARYKPDTACTGTLVERRCLLLLATVQYPVNITDDVVTLGDWAEDRNDTLTLLTRYDNGVSAAGYGITYSGAAAGYYVSMLGGLYTVLDSLYASSLNLRLAVTTETPYIMTGSGIVASSYLTSGHDSYSNCSMAWTDPMADIVNTARELMLRSVIAYSKGNLTISAHPQTIDVVQVAKVLTVYRSSYRFLVGTLVAMVLQMAAILYLLLGWQRLGRDISLDGFELARALGAPILQAGSSNSPINDGLEPHLRRPLRYGEISEDTAASWTAAAAAVHEGIASFRLHGGNQGTWLALDYADRVGPIRKDVPY